MSEQAKNEIQIPVEILGVELPGDAIEALKSGQETNLIEGFTSKNGKSFNAHLFIDERDGEKRIMFKFEKVIPNEVAGVKLTEEAKLALKQGKETELIKDFTSKNGIKYNAYLRFDKHNKLQFRFPENKLKIPVSVGGVKLSEEDIEKLKKGERTGLIRGINNKNKPGTKIDAYLKVDKEKKQVVFEFPEKTRETAVQNGEDEKKAKKPGMSM